MESVRVFGAGVATGFLLIGCAGAVFPYKYYALDAKSYQGSLRGEKPADDLDLSICTPTTSNAAPCIVMKASDFIQAKTEFKDLEDRLNRCEQGKRQGD